MNVGRNVIPAKRFCVLISMYRLSRLYNDTLVGVAEFCLILVKIGLNDTPLRRFDTAII